MRVRITGYKCTLKCELGFWVRNAGQDYGLRMRFECGLGFRVIISDEEWG